VETPPDWVEAPNPLNPNFTSISYKRQVVLSLLQDGNAFVAVSPDTLDPTRLLVLNPAQVEIKDGDGMPAYVVTDGSGRKTLDVLTPFNCLHIPFILPPGYTRGLNPVEAAALTIGVDLAAQKQASKFVSGGGLVTGVIEVPRETGELTQEQMDNLREGFKRRREGPSGYSIGVLQGGATFKPVSQSQAESDYIAGRKLSREEIAGMYLVPAFMIGSQEPGGVAYASAVERAQHFIDYCLIHYSGPIEKGHNRLLPTGEFYRLNYNALLRGDMKTRVGIYDTLLQDRVVKVDQVRELEDWAPVGEGAGGGFLETPNNTPVQAAPAPRSDVHVHVPEITLPDTVAIPAPIVHSPAVNVPAPIVNVEAQPAPDMTPVADAVRELQDVLAQPVTRTVKRDRLGRAESVVETRAK
jgi:HK97 family phage portal protein